MKKDNKNEKNKLNFYSREIGAFGLDTMKKISKLNIIVFGISGLGIEISKNVILSGPNKVAIYDYHIIKISDLNSNFYINNEDINKKRIDEAVIEKLKALNDDVDVEIFNSKESLFESSKIDNEDIIFKELKEYHIIVLTKICHINIINKIEHFCYENNKGFIYCGCLGLVGFIYNNFGKEFIVNKPYLNEKRIFFIKKIEKLNYKNEDDKKENNYGQLLIKYENGMKDISPLLKGDYITFKEIEGMEFLNQKDTLSKFKIEKVFENNSFIINFYSEDSNIMNEFVNSEYKKGGIITEYIQPIKMNFKTFDECLENPVCDLNILKFNSNELNHSIIYGVQKYYDEFLSLPELNNESQIKIIVGKSLAFYDKKYNQNKLNLINDNSTKDDNESISDSNSSCSDIESNINYELFRPLEFKNKNYETKKIFNLSKWLKSEIPPVCSYFGGIISQEIIKFTGKYIPINQFYWYDFYDSIRCIAENERLSQNYQVLSRYSDQIAIFGNKFQEIISKTNIFLIGAGAIGCEYLKNLALMGFSTSINSKITVTDNDNIEISNLNRQFLFKKENVGRSKSKCACLAAKEMNNSCNFEDRQLLVNTKSENIFNSTFWKKQNFVLNAVDNIKARKYIDSQTTLFKIPLIETATEGLKAHCQIIIPFLTQNYSEREYNREGNNVDNTHSCTLKQFPYLIDHCIEWGKLHFEKYFNKDIENIINIFANTEKIINDLNRKKITSKLNKLKKYIWFLNILEVYNEEKNEKKIIEILMGKGIEIFYKLFFIKIKTILNLYPINFKTIEGNYFWSGEKRRPETLEFNINDELSFEFVKSFIILLLNSLNLNLFNYNKNESHFNEYLKLIYNQEINDLSKNNAINNNKLINELNDNKNINNIEERLLNEIKIYEVIFKEKVDLIKNKKWFNIDSFIPIVFEKDNDYNYHIEFINACSNLRARNYRIKECTKLDTKLISGKIIPALASTTSIIVGYGCCSLLTLISNQLVNLMENKEYNSEKKIYDINLFHEIRINLSKNLYIICFPPKVKIFKSYKILNVEYINYKRNKMMNKNSLKKSEEKEDLTKKNKIKKYIHIIPKPEPFSVWDNLTIDNSFSFNEMKNYFKQKYQVNLNGIYTLDKKCLTSDKQLFDTKIEKAYKNEDKNNQKEFLLFEIDATSDNDDIVKFPVVKYNYLFYNKFL